MVEKYPAHYAADGVAVDEHLKALLDLIQSLCDISPTSRDIESIELKFADLLDLLASHFASEEALMVDTGYPGYAKHSNEHTLILQMYGSFFYEKVSMLSPSRRVHLKALSNILTDHKKEHDSQFLYFYQQPRTSLGACVLSAVSAGLGNACGFLQHT